MRHPLTEERETGIEIEEAVRSTRPIVVDRTLRPPGRPQPATDLELVFSVVNGEDEVPGQLAGAASCLVALEVSVGIAVVDRGSSDRTVEAVDAVAAAALVPIRVLGCSAPEWGAAARRAATTSRARWVGFGELGSIGPGTIDALHHATRLLGDGQHIVCLSQPGSLTVLETGVAAELFADRLPPGPGWVPEIADVPRYAGLRMAAYGTSSPGRAKPRHKRGFLPEKRENPASEEKSDKHGVLTGKGERGIR